MPQKFLNGADLNSRKIINVLDPTVAQDAATKNYVDTHSNFTAGTWTNATMGTGIGGSLQYRSEPVYGVVRLRTNGRIFASSGTPGAGFTIATLPAGFRPATEFKLITYQGAEPTQNALIVKVSTGGVVSIVNSITLSSVQANGIILDHTFSTS